MKTLDADSLRVSHCVLRGEAFTHSHKKIPRGMCAGFLPAVDDDPTALRGVMNYRVWAVDGAGSAGAPANSSTDSLPSRSLSS